MCFLISLVRFYFLSIFISNISHSKYSLRKIAKLNWWPMGDGGLWFIIKPRWCLIKQQMVHSVLSFDLSIMYTTQWLRFSGSVKTVAFFFSLIESFSIPCWFLNINFSRGIEKSLSNYNRMFFFCFVFALLMTVHLLIPHFSAVHISCIFSAWWMVNEKVGDGRPQQGTQIGSEIWQRWNLPQFVMLRLTCWIILPVELNAAFLLQMFIFVWQAT